MFKRESVTTIVDDSKEQTRVRRVVMIGRLGPGLAKFTVAASIIDPLIVETSGEELSDESA